MKINLNVSLQPKSPKDNLYTYIAETELPEPLKLEKKVLVKVISKWTWLLCCCLLIEIVQRGG